MARCPSNDSHKPTFLRFPRVPAAGTRGGYQQNGEPLCSLQSPAMVTSASPASASRPRACRCIVALAARLHMRLRMQRRRAGARRSLPIVAEKKSDLDTHLTRYTRSTVAVHDITDDQKTLMLNIRQNPLVSVKVKIFILFLLHFCKFYTQKQFFKYFLIYLSVN